MTTPVAPLRLTRHWPFTPAAGVDCAAFVHRGVQSAHTARRRGGWDSIRVDEGAIWSGVREVRHAVVAYAPRELETHHRLLRCHLGACESRRLQVPAGAESLRESRESGVYRRAVCYPIDGELARRAWVREPADTVGAHALGELDRLLTRGGGAVATAAAGPAVSPLLRVPPQPALITGTTATMASAASGRSVLLIVTPFVR